MQWVAFGAGSLFAAAVINPNYINRRSWYLRKISTLSFGFIGYLFVRRYTEDQLTFFWMKNNDYLPVDIKRALRDQDYRHIALHTHDFDLNNKKYAENGKAFS